MNPHEPMESACPSETEEAISDEEEEDLEGIFFYAGKKPFLMSEMAIFSYFYGGKYVQIMQWKTIFSHIAKVLVLNETFLKEDIVILNSCKWQNLPS